MTSSSFNDIPDFSRDDTVEHRIIDNDATIAAERAHSYEDDYIPSLISDKPAVASSQKPYKNQIV